ncbi:hypothetical protein ACQKK5_15285 [Brevibacillus panacihumi]|uniref:hypothetical protein n=1 Tax=Brevibacillus panacihumi TaxID=497735 RepID=UPI003CFC5E51
MLSKAKMGMLFGSMAAVLSLGMLGSAYAADADQAKTNYTVEGKQNFGKVKMGGHAGVFGGVAFKENKALLELLGLEEEELKEAQKAGKSLSEIAEAQGVDKQAVIDLLVNEQADKLAEAVAAGKLTQEQSDKLSENAGERIAELVENSHPGKMGMGRGFGVFGQSEALLKLLGLEAEELKEAQKAGKSLAEIAEAQGVDKQPVIDLLVKEQAEKMAEAVTAGKLTQEQADKMSENARERVEEQVTNPHPGKARGMGKGFFGFGQNEELLALLKLDAAQLQEALKAGKSLAEVAKEQGVDQEEVIALLQEAHEDMLAKAVEEGKLTQEQADQQLDKAKEQATKMVEGTFKKVRSSEAAKE